MGAGQFWLVALAAILHWSNGKVICAGDDVVACAAAVRGQKIAIPASNKNTPVNVARVKCMSEM